MKKKGFTLIELMIVIAIIAILASIIIPNIRRAKARAQMTACMENLKSLATAMEMAAIEYPNEYKQGRFYPGNTNLDFLHPEFVATYPTCPAGGQYYYLCFYTEENRLHVDDDSMDAHSEIIGDYNNYFGYYTYEGSNGWCLEEMYGDRD